jgi:hypothetical protein
MDTELDPLYRAVDAILTGAATGNEYLAVGGGLAALVIGFLRYRKSTRVIHADATNKEEIPGPKT